MNKPIIKLSLLICTTILLSTQCKKTEQEKQDYVQGYMWDAYTKKGVPNARVELWADYNSGTNAIQDYDKFLNATYTDVNGHYYMDYKEKQTAILGVFPTKKNYYDYGEGSNFRMGQHDVDFNMSPLAWVQFHIKNTQPINQNDSLIFNYIRFFIGNNVDSIFIDSINASRPPLYTWIIKKNGIQSGGLWYSACTPFDTCTYNIFY